MDGIAGNRLRVKLRRLSTRKPRQPWAALGGGDGGVGGGGGSWSGTPQGWRGHVSLLSSKGEDGAWGQPYRRWPVAEQGPCRPPVCCWNTSMVSSSSISSWAGVSVSLMGCPSNRNLICLIDKPCRSQ